MLYLRVEPDNCEVGSLPPKTASHLACFVTVIPCDARWQSSTNSSTVKADLLPAGEDGLHRKPWI